MSFVAKKETVPVLKISTPMILIRLGCEQPDSLGTIWRTKKTLPVIMVMDLQIIPIIHATTLQVSIRDLKAQRMNEMERTASVGT